MAPRVRLALTVAVTCAAAMAAIAVVSARSGVGAATGQAPRKVGGFYGRLEPAGFPAVQFALPDQHGATVSLRSFAGRVVALAFVYSTCASSCPQAVDQLRAAVGELPRPIPMLAISVDPRQDTRANVNAFLIREEVVGQLEYLVAGRRSLAPIWRRFGIQPQQHLNSARADHATEVVLLDRTGRARVEYRGLAQMDPDAIAADIRTLEAEPLPRTLPRRLPL